MNRFSEVVWPAVLAAVSAATSLILGVFGASLEAVVGAGLFGLVMATLAARS